MSLTEDVRLLMERGEKRALDSFERFSKLIRFVHLKYIFLLQFTQFFYSFSL